MSSAPPKLVATNLPLHELVMDTRGDKDPRYYCLPPIRGTRDFAGRKRGAEGKGFPFHLVAQGHRVGLFNNW